MLRLTGPNLPLELTAAWRNAVLGAMLGYLDVRRSSAARYAETGVTKSLLTR